MSEIEPEEPRDCVHVSGEDRLVPGTRHRDDVVDWYVPESTNADGYGEHRSDPDAARQAPTDVPDDPKITTLSALPYVSGPNRCAASE